MGEKNKSALGNRYIPYNFLHDRRERDKNQLSIACSVTDLTDDDEEEKILLHKQKYKKLIKNFF